MGHYKSQNIEMGCYGVGVSRSISLIIDNNYDAKGILWPVKITPFIVSIVISHNLYIYNITNYIYDKLQKRKVTVLYDTRNISMSNKLKDHDLIGIPIVVICGSNFINKGIIEIK